VLVSGAAALPAAMQAHLRGCSACEEEARSLLLPAADERGVDASPVLARLTAGYLRVPCPRAGSMRTFACSVCCS
jgi:hypothetical protein